MYNSLSCYSSLARNGQWSGNEIILPITASQNFWSRAIFCNLRTTSEKAHRSRKKVTCELDPSVVSLLRGLALMKTTILESIRTLPYFRLDTLTSVYYAMYKRSSLSSEGNDRETALHGTLVYIVTIYDVITKTARVLCQTYSCPYCIFEPVTYVLT